MAGPDVPEFLLYLRKSNGRKAVPRQRVITPLSSPSWGRGSGKSSLTPIQRRFRKVDGAEPVSR
jgi:hypothetical protein